MVLPLVGLDLEGDFLIDRDVHGLSHLVTELDSLCGIHFRLLHFVVCEAQVLCLTAVLGFELLSQLVLFCKLMYQVLRLKQELEEFRDLQAEEVKELRIDFGLLCVEAALLHRAQQAVFDEAGGLLLCLTLELFRASLVESGAQ